MPPRGRPRQHEHGQRQSAQSAGLCFCLHVRFLLSIKKRSVPTEAQRKQGGLFPERNRPLHDQPRAPPDADPTGRQVSRLGFFLLGRLPAGCGSGLCPLVSFTVTGIAWKLHPIPAAQTRRPPLGATLLRFPYSIGSIIPATACGVNAPPLHKTCPPVFSGGHGLAMLLRLAGRLRPLPAPCAAAFRSAYTAGRSQSRSPRP